MEKHEQLKLVKKAKKGDDQAFIQLCEAYQHVIYNAAYKILLSHADACDCVQETEIKAWQKIKSLKNEAAFNTWLFKIMLNIANTMLKQKQKYVVLHDYHLSTINEVVLSDNHDDVKEILGNLPDKYRIILVLYYYVGFSIKMIAKQEGISVNTVKTRMARGRKLLKTLLEDKKYG